MTNNNTSGKDCSGRIDNAEQITSDLLDALDAPDAVAEQFTELVGCLSDTVDDLKDENDQLHAENDNLRDRVDELEEQPEVAVEDDTDPETAHDRWTDMTNLEADDLRELQDSRRNEVYLEKAEGNQGSDDPPLPGGPLEDAITLAETPADEWTEDHVAEAAEARNFAARTLPQFEDGEGKPLLPEEEPDVHKGELALQRWGIDPVEDDGFLE